MEGVQKAIAASKEPLPRWLDLSIDTSVVRGEVDALQSKWTDKDVRQLSTDIRAINAAVQASIKNSGQPANEELARLLLRLMYIQWDVMRAQKQYSALPNLSDLENSMIDDTLV